MHVCGSVLRRRLSVCVCVCLASVGSPWEEDGKSVMNCEEVADLSDQTQGNKEEPER